MKITYDFHIHTTLSPCGDELMTPHNIVNMCLLNEVDVIAITDHNTCGNCEAVMEVGKQKGLLVIPGMEIESIEEFHNVALFPSLQAANCVESKLRNHRLPIRNKSHIFGHQQKINCKGEVIEEEEWLLVTAVQVMATEIYDWVEEVGGVIYPAHIDRNAYSILSNLGAIPEELKISCLEISSEALFSQYQKQYNQYTIMQSSDAHYLEQLCVPKQILEVDKLNITHILNNLRR